MGKGDKKSRRGKIIIGTFGVRRRRKKDAKQDIKQPIAASVKEVKEKKPVKEKAEVKEAKAEVKEVKAAKEKSAPKAPKAAREKKEITDSAVEPKPKKEKKS